MKNNIFLCLFLLSVSGLTFFQCSSPAGKKQASSDAQVEYVLDSVFAKNIGSYTFDSVSWVTIDPGTGNLFVLQRKFPPVSVWTPQGKMVAEWKTEALGYPHALEIHYDNQIPYVWITDFSAPQTAGEGWGHCIKKFTIDGRYVGAIGACGPHTQGSGLKPVQFDKVTDISFDARGNLFVTDGDMGGLNNRLLKLNPSGEVLMVLSAPNNKPGSGPCQFNLPHEVVIDPLDRVWVVDKLNNRVQVLRTDGSFIAEWKFDPAMGPNGLGIGAPALKNGTTVADVLVTASPIDVNSNLQGQAWVIPALMDPRNPGQIGPMQPMAHWQIPNQEGSAMLHSSTISPFDGALYMSFLNRHSAPLKYIRKTANKGIVVQPDQGEHLVFRAPPVPDSIRVIISPDVGSNLFSMGTQDLPVNYLVPVHKHETEDEVLFFHKGHGHATLDGKTVAVQPGTTIFIPHGTWHSVHNTSDAPGQMVWFVAKPGLEDFFREGSQHPGTPWTPLTPQEIDAIGRKHGVIFASDSTSTKNQ